MEDNYDQIKVNQLMENLRHHDVNIVEKPRNYYDSNSPKHTRTMIEAFGELISKKDLYNRIRMNFQKNLGKLNDNSTKERAFNELQQIIIRYYDMESLRIYISLLSIHHKNCSIAAKECQVLLIGYIASIYKVNLMDPLDKPPNVLSTIVRLFGILNNFMKESSFGIHKACSHSLIELFDNCMPKDDIKAISVFLIDPLISIINTGTNKNEQLASTICFSDLISYLKENNLKFAIESLCPKLLSLIIKSKCDSPYLFDSLNTVLEALNFDYFTPYLKEIYDRLTQIILNSKNYLTRIESCKAFGIIANKLKSVADLVIGFFHRDIICTLQIASKDRVHKVQIAGNEALKLWNELELIYNDLELKKTKPRSDYNQEKEISGNIINPSKLQANNNLDDQNNFNKLNKLNLLRNLSKLNKTSNRDYSPELLKEDIYKKGISQLINTNNFMKNRDSSSALLKKNFTIYKINKSPQDQVKDSIKNFIKNKNRNINEQSNENIQLYVKDKTTELKNEDDIENRQIFKNKIEKSDRSIRQITEHTFKNFDSLDEINKIHNKKLDENQIKKENMTFDKISQYFFSNFDIMCKNLLNEFEMKSLQISSKINKLDKMIKNIQVSVPSNVLPIINNELGNEIHKKNTTNFFSNSDKIENEKNEEIIENKINLVNRVFNNRPINEKNKEEYYSDEEQIHQENNFENLNNIPEKMDLKHNLQNQINNNLYTEKTFKNKNHLEKNVKISKEIYEKLYKEIYHKIKKEQVQKTPEIVKIWENSLNEISKNNFDSAYESILNSGDDIYLLRLIYLTGPALDKLNNDLSKRVLLRINQISRSHQIQQVTYNLIKQCNETKIILSIDSEDQNEILETLYEFSGISSELGVKSANLYTILIKEILK